MIGQTIGHYKITEKLGEGGMAEVYLAEDTSLDRKVALKFLSETLRQDEIALKRFIQEAKSAAALDHPFICKIFEAGRIDGQDFIAMEFVPGQSLKERLSEGPLKIEEFFQIAGEISEALEEAHNRKIVHRDLKPANIMLMPGGHIKVMDFGLAKRIPDDAVSDETQQQALTQQGAAVGTLAYMSPEQMGALEADDRSDIFSLGVLFYEALTGVHPFRGETIVETIGAIQRKEAMPPTEHRKEIHQHLSQVVLKMLAKDPRERQQNILELQTELAEALEYSVRQVGRAGRWDRSSQVARKVTPLPASLAGIRPYPGLASFTSRQAEFFFGREMEVKAMWEKLANSQLLGLIGATGSGKSSFLQAGVVPAAPKGWAIIVATPENRPFSSLAQALAGELTGDVEAVRQLLRFDEDDEGVAVVKRWRKRHEEALIVLDQFEELFTLNPEDGQKKFVHFLHRVVEECDCHVLLSMRDDFLLHCHQFEELKAIFDYLTPLLPPTGAALRRALTEPAARFGYEFEDESLVEGMVDAVSGEKAALPMLAFAAAQLWDLRDQEEGLLRRDAHEQIGGVSGALARHAEETLGKIGEHRVSLVRELFRNLITAQGTRAVRNRDELLSVFEVAQREEAAEVLDQLIDARLLVSYRVLDVEKREESSRRIEIVHESMLSNWPRLARWLAQDAEGAKLRDDLRQAARMWDQHGRPYDLLWTGTAYKEYEVWREHYPGGLTDLEEDFGKASADQARSRSKRRRYVTAAAIIFLVIGIGAITALWRQAVDETRRAEAATLLGLAQTDPEGDPTAAIAYAIASLEMHDTEFARHFVTRVLTQGPIAFSRDIEADALSLNFSPDGKWLVVGGHGGLHQVWPSDGSPPIRLAAHGDKGVPWNCFSDDGRFLVSAVLQGENRKAIIWETTRFSAVKEAALQPGEWIPGDYPSIGWLHPRGIPIFRVEEGGGLKGRLVPFEGGEPEDIGVWPRQGRSGTYRYGLESSQLLHQVDDRELYVTSGLPHQPAAPRKFGEVEQYADLSFVTENRALSWLANHPSKEMSIWSITGESGKPLRTFRGPEDRPNQCGIDPKGQWLAWPLGTKNRSSVWSLTGPVCKGPQVLQRGDRGTHSIAVDYDGRWAAVSDAKAIALWPLRDTYPSLLFQSEDWLMGVAIDPDGEWVATTGSGGLRVWSLKTTGSQYPRLLYPFDGFSMLGPVVSSNGETLAFRAAGKLVVLPVEGGSPREFAFEGLPLAGAGGAVGIAIDDSGSMVALSSGTRIQLWDLETGETQILDAGDGKPLFSLQFIEEGRLITSGPGGLRAWDLDTGESEILIPDRVGGVSPDGRYVVGGILDPERVARDVTVFDLESGESWKLPSGDGIIVRPIWHPSSRALIASDREGAIRIVPIDGGPVHFLYGHSDFAALAVDKAGKWIASASQNDGTLRLWSMPDLSMPPFHTLPHDELIARLKAMTNYRVMKDETSPSGYKIGYGPFPGWDTVPEW